MNSPQIDDVRAIHVTLEPQDPCWQLRTVESGEYRRVLVGWSRSRRPIDAGVPNTTVGILSRAVCSMGRVTFLSSGERHYGHGTVAEILDPPLWRQVLGYRSIRLITTTDSLIAADAFRDDAFSWDGATQAMFLSAPDKPPPHLSYRNVHAVVNDKVLDAQELHSSLGLSGAVLPGVDGDFAECILFGRITADVFLSHLRQQCRSEAVGYDVQDEERFKSIGWFG